MSTVNFTPTNYPEAVRAIIEARISAVWGSTTLIAWPLVPFTPTAGTSYLKVDILHGLSDVATMGATTGLNLSVGSIQLQVWVPKGQGAGLHLTGLSGQAAAIFDRYFGSGLRCGASSLRPLQYDTAWAIQTITTPFEAFVLSS